MARLNTPDPHAAERERDLALVQSNSFITTATTMLLGLLAGIAESKSRAASDDGARHHGAADSSPGADPHDAQPPLSSADHLTPAQAGLHHDSGSALIETATIARPSYAPTAEAHHAATDAAGALPASSHEPITVTPALHEMTPATAEPSHIGSGISSQLSQFGSTLSHSIDDAVTSILHSTTPSIDTAATLLNSVLSIPEGAAGSLVSATFANHTPSAVGEIIDTVSLTHIDLPTAPLPLIGQAHTDGQDHHDGAFSAIGIHHF